MSKLAALIVVGIFAVTACSSSDGSQQPPKTPPSSPTTTATPNTPSTTKLTTPDPLAGYTPLQVQAYQEALAAYQRWQIVQAQVFSEGKPTPQAVARLKAVEFDVSSDLSLLRTLASVDYTFTNYNRFPISEVQPTRVVLPKDGSGSVTISMCLSPLALREHYPKSQQYPNGRTFRPPGNSKPYGASVVMSHYPGGPWKVSGGNLLKGKSC